VVVVYLLAYCNSFSACGIYSNNKYIGYFKKVVF